METKAQEVVTNAQSTNTTSKAKNSTSSKKSTAKKEVAKAATEVAKKDGIKTSLYHDSIYADCMDNAKKQKSVRGKIRKALAKFHTSIYISTEDGKQKIRTEKDAIAFMSTKEGKAVKREFIAFYKSTYILNDFTVASLYTGSEENKLRELTQLLNAINA